MTNPRRQGPSPGNTGNRPTMAPIRASNRLQGISPSQNLPRTPEGNHSRDDEPINNPSTSEEPQPSSRPRTVTNVRLAPSPTSTDSNIRTPTEGETQVDNQDTTEYPNAHDDPDPPNFDATQEEKEARNKMIRDYGEEMLAAYRETSFEGRDLWEDFLTAFRPHSIKTWNRSAQARWTCFLRERGVHVGTDRNVRRGQNLIDLLYRMDHIGSDKSTTIARPSVSNPTDRTNEYGLRGSGRYIDAARDTEGVICNAATKDGDATPPDDSDSSETSSDDGKKDIPRRTQERAAIQTDNRTQRGERNSLGINGLMKAYNGKTTFAGGWDEDLDNCLDIFFTLANMCELTDAERLKSLPVMLSGDALTYFSNHASKCTTFDSATSLLRKWYNSDEKKARILTEWQSMTLSNYMAKSPKESEVSVFRTFVAKLMSLQKQLDPSYHDDSFLRDRLLTAVDLPAVQVTLRDRMPRSSQQAVNRIANQLCDRPRSAGSIAACATLDDSDGEANAEANYSLGKVYGGEAKGVPKKPWKAKRNGRPYRSRHPRKRLSPDWIRGVKGCFVCGQDHRASTRHSREEVTSAINKLKSRHPQALLTVEDMAAVVELANDPHTESTSEEEVRWAVDTDDDETAEVLLASVTEEDSQDLEMAFANSAFLHGRTYSEDMDSALAVMNEQLAKRDSDQFEGVRLDTAANRRSVMSIRQYEAYQKEFGLRVPIRATERRTLRGIGGHGTIVGEAMIQIPFGDLGLVIDVTFTILEEDVPSLLSNRDMIDNGLDLSLQGRYLYKGSRKQPLALENYFLIYRWKAGTTPFALYSEGELRRIHRGFGHPSVRATEKLLERAAGENIDEDTRKALQQLERGCHTCRRYAGSPRRFKLTIGTGSLKFNHRIVADTMFINSRPVVHIVDEATHFTAAAFLKTQTTAELWRTICNLWCNVYMGPPDFLSVDQGTPYVSKEMKENLSAAGVTLDEAPVETPGAIGLVERYHSPLRKAYEKIRASLTREKATDADCLRMAVFANNSTIGPEGLCPMMLVFGAVPRPARASPAPTQIERQTAIEQAKKEVVKEQAKRRLAFALRHPSGPKGKERSERLRKLPAGSPVLIYRTKTKSWEGPFKFISIEDETAVVQLNRGRKIFRSTCVRPLVDSDLEHDHEETTAWLASGKRKDGDIVRKKITKEKQAAVTYEDSRMAELKGLVDDGTFRPVKLTTLKKDQRIFGSRFVDDLKRVGESLKRKSRLVAQNYSDDEATCIPTKAPTVQRFTQRLAMALASSLPGTTTYTRDVTQAYIQSKTNLEREVYIRAPKELGLPADYVLKVEKPLYGIPESGLHWYLTYLSHHVDNLGMNRARTDPCLLYRHKDNEIDGIILLQVDDTLGIATERFLKDEEKESKAFRCKERVVVGKTPISFNGLQLRMDTDRRGFISQPDKISNLKAASNQAEFASIRALAQYIGVNSRPDLCAPVQLIAPGGEPASKGEYKMLDKAVNFAKETIMQGLTFVHIDLNTARIVLMTDASFANAKGFRTQLGYLILLADDEGRCNIIHYGSNRCKRIARSVMAAEIQALVLGFDFAFVIRDMVEELTRRSVPIEAIIDSKTMFNVIARDGQTTERRLQIDIFALRQSYDNGELRRISWIPGTANPADALTKPVLNTRSPLFKLMQTNRLTKGALGWAMSRNN